MAMTVTDFLNQLSYEIRRTITDDSDPNKGQIYNLIYQASEWILSFCADLKSELGRKDGAVSLLDGTSTYTNFADDLYAPYHKGWITKTNSRDRLDLANEEEILNYDPSSSAECQPDKFYLDKNNTLTFLSKPDASYTFTLPYWYHQTRIAAESYAITGIGLTNPCQVNFASHGFQTDDRAYIASIVGTTQLNGKWFTVTKVSDTQITLNGIDATAYTAWSSGGTVSTALPFNGVFDTIFLKYVALNIMVGDEYKVPVEQAWFQFLLTQVKRIIMMRRNPVTRITR